MLLLSRRMRRDASNRVVITGLGVVTSIGIGKDNFWGSLSKGKSGIGNLSAFNTSFSQTNHSGEIHNFDPSAWLDRQEIKKSGRATQFLLTGTYLALDDARILRDGLKNIPTAVCIGTNMGEIQALEQINEIWVNQGDWAVPKELVLLYAGQSLSSRVSAALRLVGPSFVIPTACAAGNYAIGYGYDLLRLGRAEVIIAGGVDPFSRTAFTGFNRLFSIAKDNCRPFDKNRTGIIVGEGCGVLILETLKSARSRNVEPYAEILGYGLSCDAHNMTTPTVNGIVSAMSTAITDAGMHKSEIDYICAHGTGTIANDKAESAAIKYFFGHNYYKQIPVSSIKSMLGHTMGAASAIEAVACALSIRNNLIAPTINFETPDPDCDIDCVPNVARKKLLRTVLNNSYAFGGNNSCLVLGKYDDS